MSAPSYSITTLTNQDVEVTITTFEVTTTPLGWTKTGTGPFIFKKSYSANTAETIDFTNNAG
jgi:hypothetical protein